MRCRIAQVSPGIITKLLHHITISIHNLCYTALIIAENEIDSPYICSVRLYKNHIGCICIATYIEIIYAISIFIFIIPIIHQQTILGITLKHAYSVACFIIHKVGVNDIIHILRHYRS